MPRPANGADRRTLGAYGEELAARYLETAGMEIVARNWRCRYGELDLIVRTPELTAFVEVKTRTGLGFGVPAEAVTFAKRQRIRRLALLWLAEQERPWRRLRFDVVSVLLQRGHQPVVDHLQSVF
ncbi:YraN family protein [Nocardia sp. NPDC057227]|uniref:YraN family protein n=1 Tax=Nocardia sp. NPDC057227 TaxID=3346056 RepID=UPI0036430CE1